MFKKGLFLGLALTMVCLVNTTVFCANLYIELVNVVPVPLSFFVEPKLEPPSKVEVKLLGKGSEISLNLPHLERMRRNLDVYAASMPVDISFVKDMAFVNVETIVVFFNGEPVAKTHVHHGLGFNNLGDVTIHLTRKGRYLEIMR